MIEATKGLFERHLQTFLMGLLSLLLGLNMVEISAVGKQVINIGTRLGAMEDNVNMRMLDRYTGTQATAHARFTSLQFRTVNIQIDKFERELSEFEKRLDSLEKPNSDGG